MNRTLITRFVAAACALVAGLLLLGSDRGTLAAWQESRPSGAGSITAGNVDLVQQPQTVRLFSRQPAGSRTYTSTTTCTPPSGFTECRIVTTTLGSERLVPGDTLRVSHQQMFSAVGNNLKGSLVIDASAIVTAASSTLSQKATVTTTVTPPGGTATVAAGNSATYPVVVRTNQNIGTYDVQVDIAIPAANAGARWGTALQGQHLDLTAVTTTFTQT